VRYNEIEKSMASAEVDHHKKKPDRERRKTICYQYIYDMKHKNLEDMLGRNLLNSCSSQ
jgi:hypothetical protein